MSAEDLSARQELLKEQERKVQKEVRRTTLNAIQRRSVGSNVSNNELLLWLVN